VGDGEPGGSLLPNPPTRAKAACVQRITDWKGVLVSDGSLAYQYWQGLRQSCVAHLLRTARGLARHLKSTRESL
jgi:hypothetical protein